jgi:LPPG:FO 2-phospho-L-lactate transferase
MIAVLSGGVGAARLLSGLVDVVEPESVVAVVNTGDDLRWNTLYVAPDLDTVTYTLAGLNATTGWGLEGESWRTRETLGRFGSPTWFGIGDMDLATHLYRSEQLAAGRTLSEVTAAIARSLGVRANIVPMSDQPVRTMLTLDGGEEVDFQEYFVHRRHSVAISSVRFAGVEDATASAGALEALEEAESIILAPSNPIVSLGPILAIEEVSSLLRRRRDHVVAISPIIAGAALKGPADRMLTELGHESTAVGVAELLAHVASAMVIDNADAALAPRIAALGYRVTVRNTVMRDRSTSAALAAATLDLVQTLPIDRA